MDVDQTVADLLTRSRQAHSRYRLQNTGRIDPAWRADREANSGVTHDEMLVFLGRYLTPVEAR